MKNNFFCVFNTLFSSVKAKETDRDYRDYRICLWWLFPLKKGVISTLLQEHIFSKDNYQTKENRGIWVYSVFPCVQFSGLHTKGMTFCCSSMSLGRPGTTSPGVSTEFKACCVPGKSSAATGGFGPHCHSPDIYRQVKRKKQRENCVPNESAVPQVPHCRNKNTAERYMFKSISLTSYFEQTQAKK